MIDRPIILVFNKYYLPGYRAGGPIKTIENMVERLSDKFEFRIVTLDRDAGTNAAYEEVVPNEWQALGNSKVMYLSPAQVSIRVLLKIIGSTQPQVIYLNSFFDSTFTLPVLIAKRLFQLNSVPIVIAPRGEFSLGALAIKNLKKNIFINVARPIGVYRGLIWQASSKFEKQAILKRLSWLNEGEIKVVLNLARPTERLVNRSPRRENSPLRVCFLSRINPMKNLDYALRILGQVKVPIIFTIYGPKEVPEYWRLCESLIALLPAHILIQTFGSLHPSDVRESLAKHDLFFLPTRGENYGHVIHEALSSGLPVLISDRTPWADVEKCKVGWCCALDNASTFVATIEQVSGWGEAQHQKVADSAIEYAQNQASQTDTLERNRKLFISAMEG